MYNVPSAETAIEQAGKIDQILSAEQRPGSVQTPTRVKQYDLTAKRYPTFYVDVQDSLKERPGAWLWVACPLQQFAHGIFAANELDRGLRPDGRGARQDESPSRWVESRHQSHDRVVLGQRKRARQKHLGFARPRSHVDEGASNRLRSIVSQLELEVLQPRDIAQRQVLQ